MQMLKTSYMWKRLYVESSTCSCENSKALASIIVIKL